MLKQEDLAHIKESIDNSKVGPRVLTLRLTPFCNFSCIYCKGALKDGYRYKNASRNIMDLFQLRSCFSEAKNMGVQGVVLNMLEGEPFLRRDIKEIIQEAKQMGFFGSLTTNGSLLDNEIADIIDGYNWDTISISVDSIDPHIQYTFRPSLNHSPYLSRIIDFIEYLEKTKSKVSVCLYTVVYRFTYRNLPKLIKFFKQYDVVKKIHLIKLNNPGLDKKIWSRINLMLTEDEELELKNILEEFVDNPKIEGMGQWASSRSGDLNNLDTDSRCFLNYYMISVDYDGGIVKCPQMRDSLSANITTARLKDVWRGEHLLLRERLAEHADCADVCCTLLRDINNSIKDFLKNPH